MDEKPFSIEELIRCAYQAGTPIIMIIEKPQTVVINDLAANPDSKIQIQGNNIMHKSTQIKATGSNINNESTLTNVQMLLENEPASLSKEETAARGAIREYATLLPPSQTNPEEKELLSKRVEELTKQIAKPLTERKPKLLEMSAKGLVEATRAVATAGPELISTAEKIASLVGDLFSSKPA
jgi:hypothetical protein